MRAIVYDIDSELNWNWSGELTLNPNVGSARASRLGSGPEGSEPGLETTVCAIFHLNSHSRGVLG